MNENQEPGLVRADVLQRLTLRQRMQARLNIRAARAAEPLQGYLHGLDLLLGGGSSLPALVDDFDEGGSVLILKTAFGNWSTDGEDSAPVAGQWLFLEKLADTETVDGESEEDEPYASLSQDVVKWSVTLWEDGVQDPALAWESETLEASFAEDVFAFRSWEPVPNLEDTTLEEDAVAPDSTIWLEPIEPPPPVSAAVQALLDAKLEFIAATAITDAGMTALGFTDQLEVTAGGVTHFIPVASAAWS